MTLTNVSAPIGEWQFGQLVWSGGGYKVHSNVAVKAVPLSTPLEVSGTGAEDTTSFDVQFGYTGAYTALPHGLVRRRSTTARSSKTPTRLRSPRMTVAVSSRSRSRWPGCTLPDGRW